jgi:TnsA endonuclease N terminal
MAARKGKAASGRFLPKFPEKYVGNPNRIVFRSSWELHFMKWLDKNPAVIRWASEEIAIPYINPMKFDAAGRPVISRYFPDFVVMYRDTFGNVKKEIVEIKPHNESVLRPKMSERDKQTFAVNNAKWIAAADYAKRNGAEFRVVTEKTLFQQKAIRPRS